MKQLSFRTRLVLILSLFAIAAALTLTVVWGVVAIKAVPFVTGTPAWDRVSATGAGVIEAMKGASLSDRQAAALSAHEQELTQAATQSRRVGFLARRSLAVVAVGALVTLVVIGGVASRVAGHLSRQLSRPLNELVGWADRIQRNEALPENSTVRGAPEFRVLRDRLRQMSAAIAEGRQRALEAERLEAFRESARRVAHELKNPLTPIQFAMTRLRSEAPPSLGDVVEVLDVETTRLRELARAFAQFGRLPEGPAAPVDLGEMVRYAARSSLPAGLAVEVHTEEGLPMVLGHHDALQRAVSNVLLNAADACGEAGSVRIRAGRCLLRGAEAVEVVVADNGRGIVPSELQRIWEPYVTHKAGGTGLGLAITRQAILAHDGTVSASSTPGEGSEFRLVLPVSGRMTTAHNGNA